MGAAERDAYSTASLAGSYDEDLLEDGQMEFMALCNSAPGSAIRIAHRRSSGASTPPPALAVDTAKVLCI